MLSRLRTLRPSGKLLLGAVLLLGLTAFVLLLAVQLFRIELHVDVAAVGVALAMVLVALAVLQLVRHRLRAEPTVSIGFHLRLSQPAVPGVGRYRFRLAIFYEVELEGERTKLEQGTIELRFRKRDHPELLEWCSTQITQQLTRHAELAAERYPGARVLLPPAPSTATLAEELVARPSGPAKLALQG